MKNGRGARLPDKELRALIARSAGTCQLKGCGKQLTRENLIARGFYKAHVAHIVASNPNGPRGDDERSHKLSDKIDNCMLLCAEHNKLIDELIEEYTEEGLLKMKREHESAIEKMCRALMHPYSAVVSFSSPIRGNKQVVFNRQNINESILETHQPLHMHDIDIHVETSKEYGTPDYWNCLQEDLVNSYYRKIQPLVDTPDCEHISIFSLAPIPLIIKLGYMIGDKTPCTAYQKFREPDTWRWQEEYSENSFTVQKVQIKKEGIENIAIILSLSDAISLENVRQYKADIIFEITADRTDVYSIASQGDLESFWIAYQSVLNQITNKYPNRKRVMIFPAVPNSAAFEVGRRTMGIHGHLDIYDRINGSFEKALTIGGNR